MKTIVTAALVVVGFVGITMAQVPHPGGRPIQSVGFLSNGIGFQVKASATLTNDGSGSDQTQWMTIACVADNYYEERHSTHSQAISGRIKRFSFTHQLEIVELNPPPTGREVVCTILVGFLTKRPDNIAGTTKSVRLVVNSIF